MRHGGGLRCIKGEVRVHHGEVRVHHGEVRVHHGEVTCVSLCETMVHYGEVQLCHGRGLRCVMREVRVRHGDIRVRHGDIRVRHEEVRVHHGDVRVHHGDIRVCCGEVRVRCGELAASQGASRLRLWSVIRETKEKGRVLCNYSCPSNHSAHITLHTNETPVQSRLEAHLLQCFVEAETQLVWEANGVGLEHKTQNAQQGGENENTTTFARVCAASCAVRMPTAQEATRMRAEGDRGDWSLRRCCCRGRTEARS